MSLKARLLSILFTIMMSDSQAQLDSLRLPVFIPPQLILQYFGTIEDQELCAYRYKNDQWDPVPLQVDHRQLKSIDYPYQHRWGILSDSIPFYENRSAILPKDSDVIDSLDEILCYSKSFGERAPDSAIQNLTGNQNFVSISIPSFYTNEKHYLYLFKQSFPFYSAYKPIVQYDFDREHAYADSAFIPHKMINLEQSMIRTDRYTVGFSKRWVQDEWYLQDTIDLIDRNQNFFLPGLCGRTEESFSNGEGMFLANISGNLRAIRSYMGANSGKMTTRTHFFYPDHQHIVTDLRVHPIFSIFDVLDFEEAMYGWSYRNESLGSKSLTIGEGETDLPEQAYSNWELLIAPDSSKSILIFHDVVTDMISEEYQIWGYMDDTGSYSPHPCTGDKRAIGRTGNFMTFNTDQLPISTDPRDHSHPSKQFRNIQFHRRIFYLHMLPTDKEINRLETYIEKLSIMMTR